uniref:REPAT45 n=1 Tax=Spodoptera exigua TaxID=7107 RepID=I0B5W5_SPOEX|nr:REPAT45 [Spodoptera exigua]
MKILAVVLLVAIAAGVYSNEEQGANMLNYDEQSMEESDQLSSRSSFGWGVVGIDDRLISRTYHEAYDLPYLINEQEVTYRGNQYTNISSIRIYSNYRNTTEIVLLDGGLNENYVTFGFRSPRSEGFGCRIDIYATINCHNN